MSDSIEKIKDEIIELVRNHIENDGDEALPWKKILDEGYRITPGEFWRDRMYNSIRTIIGRFEDDQYHGDKIL